MNIGRRNFLGLGIAAALMPHYAFAEEPRISESGGLAARNVFSRTSAQCEHGAAAQLRFEIEQARRLKEEQELHAILRDACIEPDSAEGREIARLLKEKQRLENERARRERNANIKVFFGSLAGAGILGAAAFVPSPFEDDG